MGSRSRVDVVEGNCHDEGTIDWWRTRRSTKEVVDSSPVLKSGEDSSSDLDR